MSALRNNIVPLTIVTFCGVATAVSVLQPELAKQQAERQGIATASEPETAQQPHVQDNAISKAMADDFREAAKELKSYNKKGPAWALREALFGKNE